ncbi:UDP-glucose dehydrogenase family protein [Cohnella panacarvi]|uniref:UDP-glucose dehydrogenase family protein n=1 Tax=Cohnella panacarvi TaxID=400776 RepID=UPI00047B84D3|nr:UDP-glucose/GDP-mannose dehydrogenase family protein [Cohnella panacarvi]
MSILIMGTGYVGITTAIMFAELGIQVTGFDSNAAKIALLNQSHLPFYERGMEPLLQRHLQEQTIRFVQDEQAAIEEHAIIFLCVGTPSNSDGSANLFAIQQASEWIGKYMREQTLVVIKSTVPVGVDERVSEWIASKQTRPIPFDVVVNPEFLREGSAVADALAPDRIVVGSDSEEAAQRLLSLYEKLDCPIIVTNPKAAIMIKYASNAFLATKISFINELARLCDGLEIDISEIAYGIGLDPRIGAMFLKAGIGYGGSCFPKDVDALLHTANSNRKSLTIIEHAAKVNRTQPLYALDVWEKVMPSAFKKATVAVLGLSFKPHTDDLREAPSLVVISELLSRQAKVRVHDPIAVLPVHFRALGVQQADTIGETLQGADAVILCTEWPEYREIDWLPMKPLLNGHIVFDGRNALDGRSLIQSGYDYYGIGSH